MTTKCYVRSLLLFFGFSGFFMTIPKNEIQFQPSPEEIRMEQEELNYERAEQALEQKYQLCLDGYGGSASFKKGKSLYKKYYVSYNNRLSAVEAKKKFLLGILETLYLINSQDKLQQYLSVRPFTLHNLEFSMWAIVERSDLDLDAPRFLKCRIHNRLGEITAEYNTFAFGPLPAEKLDFTALYKDFQDEVPDYLTETAQQILACPFIDKNELYKKYNDLQLHDESL